MENPSGVWAAGGNFEGLVGVRFASETCWSLGR